MATVDVSARPDHRFSDGTSFDQGHVYAFQIQDLREWPGIIWAERSVARWRYTTDPKRAPWSPLNLLRGKPQFVVTQQSDGHEMLRICRRRRNSVGFLPRFEIVEIGDIDRGEPERLVGSIVVSSVFRNRYTIRIGEVGEEAIWTFHLPLFSLDFRAQCATGEEVLVRVGSSKRQWTLLAQPGTDSVYLLCALAFIHREWWAYS